MAFIITFVLAKNDLTMLSDHVLSIFFTINVSDIDRHVLKIQNKFKFALFHKNLYNTANNLKSKKKLLI